MYGLLGAAGHSGSLDTALAQAAAGTFVERGQDGSGVWSEAGTVFADRQLSMLNLSAARQC